MQDDKTLKEFEKWGKTPPSHDPHGHVEDILERTEQLLPGEWYMEGNVLKGKTKLGTIAQVLPTNLILTGTDDEGRPIFKKLDI